MEDYYDALMDGLDPLRHCGNLRHFIEINLKYEWYWRFENTYWPFVKESDLTTSKDFKGEITILPPFTEEDFNRREEG
jgi:hypothetical protein